MNDKAPNFVEEGPRLNKPRGLLYRVLVSNKWTSSLIVFSVAAFLMLFWSLLEGDYSWRWTGLGAISYLLFLPMIVWMLYLVYRFITEGWSGSKKLLKNEPSLTSVETKKSTAGLIMQLLFLSMISAILAWVLYFSFLGGVIRILIISFVSTRLNFLAIGGNSYFPLAITFGTVGALTFVWWLLKLVKSAKQASLQGVNLSPWTKLLVMLLALVFTYFSVWAWVYSGLAIYRWKRDHSPPESHGLVTPPPYQPSAELKTYTNTEYKFEFMYPVSWAMVTESRVSFMDYLPNSRNYFVAIYPNNYPSQDHSARIDVYGVSLEIVKRDNPYLQRRTFESVTVNGISWTKSVFADYFVDYLTEKGGKTYHVSVAGIDLANQIVSTLKFTD